eukprot:TRINITY_DN2919_c0_g1_i1.p1 TRINITY_DN2919_c0_g1~~TRINITY_DN2919_c0_g1_i1.p1  ORF type:complete len:447 (-),score=74.28 TRINITY_DN2919_c0_g1_i1:717-1943(-)
MSIFLPDDVLKLIFQLLDLKSAVKASVTCRRNVDFVWSSFTSIGHGFFPSEEKVYEERWKTQALVNKNMETIAPKLINLSHLDLSNGYRTHLPPISLFSHLLPQLRVYKVRGIQQLDQLDALDRNKVEELELQHNGSLFETDEDFSDLFRDAVWPKLKCLTVETGYPIDLFANLIGSAPNLEDLEVNVHDVADWYSTDLDNLLSRPNIKILRLTALVTNWRFLMAALAPTEEMKRSFSREDENQHDDDDDNDVNDVKDVPMPILQAFCDYLMSTKPFFFSKFELNSDSIWAKVISLIEEPNSLPSEAFLERFYQASFPAGATSRVNYAVVSQAVDLLKSDEFVNHEDACKMLLKFAIRLLERFGPPRGEADVDSHILVWLAKPCAPMEVRFEQFVERKGRYFLQMFML